MPYPTNEILSKLDLLWKQTAIEHFTARDDPDPGKRDFLLGKGLGLEEAIKIVRRHEFPQTPEE